MPMKQWLCHFWKITVKKHKGQKGCCSTEHELQRDMVANRANVIPVHKQQTTSWNCNRIYDIYESITGTLCSFLMSIFWQESWSFGKKFKSCIKSGKPVLWWQTKDNKSDCFIKGTVAKLLGYSLQHGKKLPYYRGFLNLTGIQVGMHAH